MKIGSQNLTYKVTNHPILRKFGEEVKREMGFQLLEMKERRKGSLGCSLKREFSGLCMQT